MRLFVLAACAVACHVAQGTPELPDAGSPPDAGGPAVLQHHNDGSRSGLYDDAAFTRTVSLKRQLSFDATVSGNVYAQALYVNGGLIVATESNQVSFLRGDTGAAVWRRSLPAPVPLSKLPCGNIDPLGITGTPIIDGGALYLDAMTWDGTAPRHLVYALSLSDGSTLPGWPVDVDARLPGFVSAVQNERGALALIHGTLFVPYGGHAGDCGTYRGSVVAIPLATPQSPVLWQTRAVRGGIWAPPGLATDGDFVFAATGNTSGTSVWSDGEAVLKLSPALQVADSFAPLNWKQLDDADADIGGSGALLVHVPGATPPDLAAAIGKDGKIYLLDRGHLGGIGGALSQAQVTTGSIGAPATYTTALGTYVVFHGPGQGCATGDLTAVRISAASPPVASVAWCAQENGSGSPIATTSGVVFVVGAEGDDKVHAFDGDTGAALFTSEAFGAVRRYTAPIIANGTLYVAGDGRVYAFKP